ncbi:uncharacterized protein TNIN_75621 [Trichonephila inaurata madagascariensis]|uniref:Uncharacterized protein n=1 Tax=Trichonephila inaurata madagascariensis TaxID=2747483 RepID=A0A8X6YFU4_9ARAC|nr:uncharacterized protein TNIN_75621 [Trichonephila inaurata madagascariensis]
MERKQGSAGSPIGPTNPPQPEPHSNFQKQGSRRISQFGEHDDEDTYSHIMENTNIPLQSSTNIYQAPRVIPVHAVRASTPSHRERRSSKSRNSHRLSYKVSSMASDGHSGDESENETTYIFNREVPASYLDTHEMSEAECDRDLHEFCEKNEKFQIFEQYDGQRICIT